MKLSNTLVYQLRILLYLREHTDGLCSAKMISEDTGVPPKYTKSCLEFLKQHYLIMMPQMGRNGGYRLTDPDLSMSVIMKQLVPNKIQSHIDYRNAYDLKILLLYNLLSAEEKRFLEDLTLRDILDMKGAGEP